MYRPTLNQVFGHCLWLSNYLVVLQYASKVNLRYIGKLQLRVNYRLSVSPTFLSYGLQFRANYY